MAKPNYSFEKRQRELAKKKKKEEKAANKAASKAAGGADEEMNPNDAAMSLVRGGDADAGEAPAADSAGDAAPPRG